MPGKSLGWRSLTGYSSWGFKESDKTYQLKQQIKHLLGVLAREIRQEKGRKGTRIGKEEVNLYPQLTESDIQKILMNPLQTIRMNGFRKVVGRKDQYTKISCISYTHIEQYKNKPKEAISFKRENNKNKKQK